MDKTLVTSAVVLLASIAGLWGFEVSTPEQDVLVSGVLTLTATVSGLVATLRTIALRKRKQEGR